MNMRRTGVNLCLLSSYVRAVTCIAEEELRQGVAVANDVAACDSFVNLYSGGHGDTTLSVHLSSLPVCGKGMPHRHGHE